MAVTQNPAAILKTGLGACNITYYSGGALNITTGFISTKADVSDAAETEWVGANGTLLTCLTKNQRKTYTFECLVRDGSTITVADKGSRIDFDFYVAGTDLNGILQDVKFSIMDGVATVALTVDTVSGLTFT